MLPALVKCWTSATEIPVGARVELSERWRTVAGTVTATSPVLAAYATTLYVEADDGRCVTRRAHAIEHFAVLRPHEGR